MHPTPPRRPWQRALLRVLVGSFALWYLWTRFDMLVEMAAADVALYDPVGVARLLPVPMPPVLYGVLAALCLALGVAFTLGWRFRVVGPAFALLFFFVMCYRNSWSMVYHGRNVVVLSALVLGFVPAADALSLDALKRVPHRVQTFFARAGRDRAGDPAYGWPVRLLCAVTVAAYFLAGVAKLAGDLGWAWAGGEALRDQIVVDALRKEVLGGGTLPALTHVLYDHVWLFTAMGVLTLALELGAPLALAHRKAGWVWAALTFGMHWGIFLLMGIRFRYQLVGFIFAPFLPVEVPVRWVRHASPPGSVAADGRYPRPSRPSPATAARGCHRAGPLRLSRYRTRRGGGRAWPG